MRHRNANSCDHVDRVMHSRATQEKLTKDYTFRNTRCNPKTEQRQQILKDVADPLIVRSCDRCDAIAQYDPEP